MAINILGFTLNITELISVGGIFGAAITGWFMLKFKVQSIEEKINSIEIKNMEMADKLDKKFEPLQLQIRAQEQAQASLAATLTGIQAQLQAVSIRLDTIISHMLTNKE